MIITVNFPISAIGKKKPEKNQGFKGIRTHDLRETGAMHYQRSYEATHWEQGQFIEFISVGRASHWYRGGHALLISHFIVMFVTAVCVLFLIKLRWPKKMNFL